ncbi:MAG TPA: O-succinylhomoserine sulfhydrylase, partial [Gammaproteobacteria bacterium]|nr:O-succinylhomoserine sulfhydrylase [Gammaproteobacteria bacterium]
MDEHDLDEFAFETRAIRAGIERSAQGEHAEAIYATSSFVFESAEEAAARFSGERPGNIYSRFTNPTVRMFERRLAALEGGESCVATSSGMSAILSVCMALLRQGDQVVAAQGLFGTTTSLLNQYLTRFGVAVRFVPATDYAAWAEAIEAGRTRLLIVETPTNPLTEVVDIQKLAAMAHAADARLIVDNCFCTPALQRPLALGADIVIHSATKYLDGQGRCMGGAVVGDAETVGRDIFGFLRTAGPTLSPFNAWV